MMSSNQFTPDELQLILKTVNVAEVKGLATMNAMLQLAQKCQDMLNEAAVQAITAANKQTESPVGPVQLPPAPTSPVAPAPAATGTSAPAAAAPTGELPAS